jgi:hypothetical protein
MTFISVLPYISLFLIVHSISARGTSGGNDPGATKGGGGPDEGHPKRGGEKKKKKEVM